MKFLKFLLIFILLIIVLFFVVSIFLPSDMYVERSIKVDASPKTAFTQVNTIKNWEKWSPWTDIDPNMKITYNGPLSGQGAEYSWVSEEGKVGNGTLTLIESKPYEKIHTKLIFGGKDMGKGTWKFEQVDDSTTITWMMEGELGFFMRWAKGVMENSVGAMFDDGLQNLKQVTEKLPKSGISIVIKDMQHILCIRDSSSLDSKEISEKLSSAYDEISTFMRKNQIMLAGPPLAINNQFDKNVKWVFEAAFPLNSDEIPTPNGRLRLDKLPGGKLVKAIHKGAYEESHNTYEEIMKYIKDNKLQIAGNSYEVYLNDPSKVHVEDLETHIFFPVK